MKKIVNHFPFLSRMLLALLLGCVAIVLSGFVYKLFPIKEYFPFVGEVFLIVATWLLYRTDGKNLSALGLNPSLKNLSFLFLGLAIGVIALLAATWLRTIYTGEIWHLSSAVNTTVVIKSLYYILPTVMVQELMFRGYLFTKTISKTGVITANGLFAFLFMLVHILDHSVLQNPAQLIMLLVCIPIGHLWFATALLRSKTVLFPIGLHWGNNWAVMHVAGLTDNEQSVFYLTDQKIYTTWTPFVIMLLIFNVFFLAVTWLTWKGRWPFAKRMVRN